MRVQRIALVLYCSTSLSSCGLTPERALIPMLGRLGILLALRVPLPVFAESWLMNLALGRRGVRLRDDEA